MIRSIDDPVKDYVAPIQLYETSELLVLFETPHNRTITWNHLLRQTSDWEGTLWAARLGRSPERQTERMVDAAAQ